MMDFIAQGGALFMLPIGGVALTVVAVTGWALLAQSRGDAASAIGRRAVFHLGLFAFMLGLFSHAISLYQMMEGIESMGGSVAPAMVVGGLRVSLIAPLFGLAVFVLALVLHGALALRAHLHGPTSTD